MTHPILDHVASACQSAMIRMECGFLLRRSDGLAGVFVRRVFRVR